MAGLHLLNERGVAHWYLFYCEIKPFYTLFWSEYSVYCYINVVILAGWLMLCWMHEALCPWLTWLHCISSYSPFLPLFGSVHGMLNRTVRDSSCCALIMGILKVYLLSFILSPIKSMVSKKTLLEKEGVWFWYKLNCEIRASHINGDTFVTH